jgi:hypothetical protein
MEKVGFRFEGGFPVEAPKKPPKEKVRADSVVSLLEDLLGTTAQPAPKPASRPAARKTVKEPEVGDLLAQLESEVRLPKAAEPVRPKPAPSAGPKAPQPSIEKPSIPAARPPETKVPPPPVAPGVAPTPGTPSAPTRVATPPPAAPATQIAVAAGPAQATPRPRPPEPAPAKPLEAPSKPAQKQPPAWLEQAAPAAAAGAPSSEALFEEDGFFDLAAELERELSEEELAAAVPLAPPQEQSLEEIVEGFKRGVAETLSPEDYDTHFNLGIAYREMGLLDEAIGEFQLAAKSPDYLIDCCSLLGACFLEKGLPDLAIRWYQKGLATPNLSEDATLGLLYDLGNLYQTIGETEKARKAFVEIYGVNSSYRDVRARLEELGG